MKISRSEGFGLLEVMIAGGILAIISLAVSQVIVNMYNGQARSQQIENINELTLMVNNTIRTDGGCLNSLNGLNIPTVAPANPTSPTQVTQIRDSSGNITISSLGTPGPFSGSFPATGGGTARLTNIRFQLWSNSPNIDNVAKGAWLRINFTRNFANLPPQNDFKEVALTVVPVANQVTRCYGTGSAEFCSVLGGIYDPATGQCTQINLNNPTAMSPGHITTFGNFITTQGRLGIGTTTPQDFFHLTQNAGASGATGGYFDAVGGQAALRLRGDSDANRTYAALYLVAGNNTNPTTNSWVLTHKGTGDNPPRGFKISKWVNGIEYSGLSLSAPNIASPVPIRVGIGTTTPIYPLDIQNGASGDASIRLRSSSTDTWMLLDNVGGIGWQLLSSGPGTLSPGGSGSFGIQITDASHVVGATVPFTIKQNLDTLLLGNNVGIGHVNPSYKLDVFGTARISSNVIMGSNLNVNNNIVAGGTITATSDRRLKRDILPLEKSLDKILSLQGVEYFWKDTKKDPTKQIGLIAQDVEKEFPALVKTDEKGFKSVAYQNLVAPLIEAIRELLEKINFLESHTDKEIAKLKRENKELREALCEIKSDAKICRLKTTQEDDLE